MIALSNGLFALWLIASPIDPAPFPASVAIGQAICGLIAGLVCLAGSGWRTLLGARVGADAPPHWPSILHGLCKFTYAGGALLWLLDTTLRPGAAPFPTLGDASYLLSYPLCLAGFLCLPWRPVSGAVRARVTFDSLMVMITVVTFSWFFILGPLVLQGEGSLAVKVLGLAYPLGDLIVFSCLLLMASPLGGAKRPGLLLLILGMGLLIAADSAFTYSTLHGAYLGGGWMELAWPLAHGLGALGMRVLRAAPASAGGDARRGGGIARPTLLWPQLLPYSLLPAVVGLLAYTAGQPGDIWLDRGVMIGAGALLIVIISRQVLALLENERLQRASVSHARSLEQLNTELRATRDELSANNTALVAANARLQALAATDALTGLPNQQMIATLVERELSRARRHGRPGAVLFFDLDHFKALNDNYGHAAGDSVLRECAGVVRAALRDGDQAGRWGGEEFIAFLTEAAPDEALAVAERLRRAVAGHRFAIGGGIHLTCSVGVATYPRDATERADVIDLADQAMYAAKRLGRNQVRAIDDPAVAALLGESGHGESREATALLGVVEALAALAETREHRTNAHADTIATLVPRLASALGLDAAEARMVGLAGRLHDLGKIAVPDTVLHKPAGLTVEEWALVRAHPLIGAEVVSRIPALRGLAPLIRAHHERWDGQGYPDGLAGEAIPLGARILAVVDAFAAMTSTRPHRPALAIGRAGEELRRCAGTQFDPEVVAALEAILAGDPAFASPGGARWLAAAGRP